MKNTKIGIIILLVIPIFISCEKILFDFRNKYLGNWEFDVSSSHETYNVTQGFHDTTTTFIYHGKIKYGSSHRSILFQANGYSQEFSIDHDGTLIAVNVYGPNYSESGGFQGRSIFKYHYYHHWGATSKYMATNIDGVKE
jgi:hypothetical protein